MDDDTRRYLHQLIERAVNKDSMACMAIEQMILDLERKGAADDAALALQILRSLAPDHVYEQVVFRLPGREHYPDPLLNIGGGF